MAVEVVAATGDLLERILDQTFPVWGEGLDRPAYAKYNRAQLATPWGGRISGVSRSSTTAGCWPPQNATT